MSAPTICRACGGQIDNAPSSLCEKCWQQMLVNGITDDLLGYVNGAPQLQSLLFDMDLMPEQLERKSKDWNRMLVLAVWHRHEFAKKQ